MSCSLWFRSEPKCTSEQKCSQEEEIAPGLLYSWGARPCPADPGETRAIRCAASPLSALPRERSDAQDEQGRVGVHKQSLGGSQEQPRPLLLRQEEAPSSPPASLLPEASTASPWETRRRDRAWPDWCVFPQSTTARGQTLATASMGSEWSPTRSSSLGLLRSSFNQEMFGMKGERTHVLGWIDQIFRFQVLVAGL